LWREKKECTIHKSEIPLKILACTLRSGKLTTVDGTCINGSKHFAVRCNSNNVTLQVVSGSQDIGVTF
jgi:hypothetical protein